MFTQPKSCDWHFSKACDFPPLNSNFPDFVKICVNLIVCSLAINFQNYKLVELRCSILSLKILNFPSSDNFWLHQ